MVQVPHAFSKPEARNPSHANPEREASADREEDDSDQGVLWDIHKEIQFSGARRPTEPGATDPSLRTVHHARACERYDGRLAGSLRHHSC